MTELLFPYNVRVCAVYNRKTAPVVLSVAYGIRVRTDRIRVTL